MPLSAFHPTIQAWFASRFGEPSPPQRDGWPAIHAGKSTLIAAPTGSGKTLAAFLSAIDSLLRRGPRLPDETIILYVSPLKALGNDVQKNLQQPLRELREMNSILPDVRVLVRTGDTPARQRASMARKPPHILVTTPESLYILLTSESGRRMLRTVRTAIIDEIHVLPRDKRGPHLALSLERLEALAGPLQRIGLSATQKPIEDVARFLVGVGRHCHTIDIGHRRELDLGVETPQTPLDAVCSTDAWSEIYARVATLIHEHNTTLLFVNTRKLAERIAARLTDVLGEHQVTCHHGSMSRERRLDAEQRLKEGRLRALVATASLELGIDVGNVDLVIQIGSARSIATFLQRVGRSGHSLRRVPKGRIFPLTIDELVEAAALIRAVRRGDLDRTPHSRAPLDILSQQIVAACSCETWDAPALFRLFRRAWPYRDLTPEDFDAAAALHTAGKHGLLHRDGVANRLRGRRRARLAAITGGGAIPDVADYQVRLEPEGTLVGSLNEDFAIESNVGDIFQLGNTSWRILKIEQGTIRVADAKGAPPSIPFWLGEAPGRTMELSHEVGRIRDETDHPDSLVRESGLSHAAALQVIDYLRDGRSSLGAVPTQSRIILERFFDESGGMQLVIHAPFGGRINRAWGLALRKRFCRGFGFELQAAANEDAIVISLGLQHSFPLDEVFTFLHPNSVRQVLTQACLDQPMFASRWRWNLTRSLLIERMRNGRRVPAPIVRMRADDLLALSFPHAIACPENLPAGDLEVPMDHPIVRQTIEDCLHEAMDIDGLTAVLNALVAGRIERVAIDTPAPSAFARGILSAQPYSFLDDAPLEERRTQAVLARRGLDPRTADELGALDPVAVQRVREEIWPSPTNAEEVHESLLWMGFVTDAEASDWLPWLNALLALGRVRRERGCWFAVDGMSDPKNILRGRLEALGPVFADDPRISACAASSRPSNSGDEPSIDYLLSTLEREGAVLRTRLDRRQAWCERRLLARIHRYTLDRLRAEIEPVSAADFLRFLARWQHADDRHRLDGPCGVAHVVRQLAGFEVPAALWEASILPSRVNGYRREWLDDLTLTGQAAWIRLWTAGACPIRVAPMCLLPRDELDMWLSIRRVAAAEAPLSSAAADVLGVVASRGALFAQEIALATSLLPTHFEMALAELIARGRITCDSYAGLRQLIVPPSRRRRQVRAVGRWSIVPTPTNDADAATFSDAQVDFVARRLLARTGVVLRATIQRERLPVPWFQIIRSLRRLELRGEVRGGRFVAGQAGEQFALPAAVEMLRASRRLARNDVDPPSPPVVVLAADPLNFRGILTPEPRVSPQTRRLVLVG